MQITSPVNNDTVSKPEVMVKGTIINATGNETGVTVNGVLALVEGDQFVANHVPLQEGENAITALATDTEGNLRSATVTVSAQIAGDYLKITADTQTGVSPFETILRVESSLDLTSLVISPTGPASVDTLESIGNNEYRAVMSTSGIYYFTAEVTDDQNNTFTDTVAVLVMDRAELDALLNAKWDGMKAALINSDIDSALNYFYESSKDDYNEIFNILSNRIYGIAAGMREIEFVYSTDHNAKYRVKKQEQIQGQLYDITYYIYFIQDHNGLWRIDRF